MDNLDNPHTLDPFTLAPVLTALFKVCNMQTLKMLRLICKKWEYCSHSVFASRTQIDLAKISYHQLEEIMQHVEKGHDLPTFNLTMSVETYENLHHSRDIIVSGGTYLHSLTIVDWELNEGLCDQPFISQLFSTTLHLKYLELGRLSESLAKSCIFPFPVQRWPALWRLKTLVIFGGTSTSIDFMVNLFSAMPNIEVMKIESACTGFLDKMLSALSKVRLRTLYSIMLSLLDNLNIFHIQHLIHAHMNLRTLHIKNRYADESPVGYEKLFRQYAFSLNDLAINCTCSSIETTNFLNISIMPFLKKLKLNSPIHGASIWKLQFLNKLPNLRYIELGHDKCKLLKYTSICYIDCDKTDSHLNLERLDIKDLQRPPLRLGCLEEMLKRFPSLSSLVFTADDSSLQLVYHHVPQLKHLVITGGADITDKGITGLVFASEYASYNRVTHSSIIPMNLNVSLGIASLKHLKTIKFDSTWGKIAITDASIFHGLAHLESLTSASFTNCDITENGLKVLQQSFVNVKVN